MQIIIIVIIIMSEMFAKTLVISQRFPGSNPPADPKFKINNV